MTFWVIEMMNILLVEDDQFKRVKISSSLNEFLPDASLKVAESVSAAVLAVQENIYEWIVLDMALPSHSLVAGGGASTSLLSGGLEVLFELNYMNRTDPVIIVTQYPEIEIDEELIPLKKVTKHLKSICNANVIDSIYYENDETSWQTRLESLITP